MPPSNTRTVFSDDRMPSRQRNLLFNWNENVICCWYSDGNYFPTLEPAYLWCEYWALLINTNNQHWLGNNICNTVSICLRIVFAFATLTPDRLYDSQSGEYIFGIHDNDTTDIRYMHTCSLNEGLHNTVWRRHCICNCLSLASPSTQHCQCASIHI